MIKDRVFVVFGDDWGRYPSTLQHIMKELIKYNKLIWIGSLGLRKPKFSILDLKRIFEKVKNIFIKKEVAILDQNITILHPFVLPFHNISFVRNINKNKIVTEINNALSKLGKDKPIIVTSQPIVGDVIGEIGDTSAHYFCLDDYTQFDGAYKIIEQLEKELLEKSDTCFSVSEILVKTRVPKTGRSYFLPQGVNIDHFKYAEPSINNTPIIGFFGLVSEWIDINLIIKAAKKYPNYKFEIIGRHSVSVDPLANIPNLEYVGEIPYNELPKRASKFTVGIIPFIVNELTLACNPLKYLEYISMGIPVISTNLPEVAKFGKAVYIAKDEKEFLELIPIAVENNCEEHNKERRFVAEKYSWYAIAENISNLIVDSETQKQK